MTFCDSLSITVVIIVMFHLHCCWYHMMLMPVASHDHVASPFDYLDVTNGMVQFMTPLASCDTDTSTNGTT